MRRTIVCTILYDKIYALKITDTNILPISKRKYSFALENINPGDCFQNFIVSIEF